jgi:hypothetical protein
MRILTREVPEITALPISSKASAATTGYGSKKLIIPLV